MLEASKRVSRSTKNLKEKKSRRRRQKSPLRAPFSLLALECPPCCGAMPPYSGLVAAFVCVGPRPVWRTQHPSSSRHQLRADHGDVGITPPVGESDAGLLGLSLDELGLALGGSGRAVAVWDIINSGFDPNLLTEDGEDPSDASVTAAWRDVMQPTVEDDEPSRVLAADEQFNQETRPNVRLGRAAFQSMQKLMKRYRKPNDEGQIHTIENSIAALSQLKRSNDGTTKLLIKMRKDGLEVESVIIPWFGKGFSTLCVSSQVGVSR